MRVALVMNCRILDDSDAELKPIHPPGERLFLPQISCRRDAASMLEIAEGLRLAGQRLGKLVLTAEQVQHLADPEPEDGVREGGADGGSCASVAARTVLPMPPMSCRPNTCPRPVMATRGELSLGAFTTGK
jgi:hypothetical protein